MSNPPNPWRQRWEVARWEFRRFVKPKQLLISLAFTVALGAAGYLLARVAERNAQVDVQIAVVGGEALTLPAFGGSGIRFIPRTYDEREALIRDVAERRREGVLDLSGAEPTLHVRRERPWRNAVLARYAAAHQAVQLREAGLTPEQQASLLTVPEVRVRVTDEQRGGRAARIAAAAASGAVLYGVFMAMALMLVSVTGEKQQRVTEQLIACIRPQEWIDGKILGIAAAAMVNIVLLALAAVIFFGGRALAQGTWSAPQAIGNPVLLVTILLFALLGFAFWLTLFGAIAATIDDPNTSTRGPLMFLPALFQSAAFMILPNPDSLLARALGILPLTSSGVMPVRLASTDVRAWEVLLSAALLVLSIVVLRRLAGRVFALGMLMTGKEPSWQEVRRWMREA